jgi:secreted trypsin-like serine protease
MKFLLILVAFLSYSITKISGTPIHFNEDSLLINPKVIGGPSSPHEFPWQVSLQWDQGHFCGGVIISPNVVLTTATCAKISNTFYLNVYAGLHNLNELEAPGVQVRKPVSLNSHPQHPSGPNEYGNNIAIIKLSAAEPFEFDEYVDAIPLPPVCNKFT